MSCVWLLCHPVAGVRLCVIGEAYQDREGRRSSQEGRQDGAHGVEGLKDVVARSMLMHREIEEDRPPQPGQVRSMKAAAACPVMRSGIRGQCWRGWTGYSPVQSSTDPICKNSRPRCHF